MNRISIIGTCGSGKTTLAAKLSEILGVSHIELDSLNWEPGWRPAPIEVFRSRLREALQDHRWVVDGNYSHDAGDLIADRADTYIWLNYSLSIILYRIVRRTLRRIILREVCCNGNIESFGKALSRDSIILWALRTHHRRRAEYPDRLMALEQRGAKIIELHSPEETNRWLARLNGRP